MEPRGIIHQARRLTDKKVSHAHTFVCDYQNALPMVSVGYTSDQGCTILRNNHHSAIKMCILKRSLAIWSIRAFPFWLAGCGGAMMETRPWPPTTENGAPAPVLQGIPYFLPKAALAITITSSRSAQNNSAAPAPALAAGADAGAAHTQIAPSAQPQISSDKSPVTAKPATLLSVSAENTVDLSTANQGAKAAPYTLTAAAAVPSFLPDYTQKYYLRYMVDNNADSVLSLHTDANNLLSTVSGDYTDETAAEAATLAQLAATIATTAASGPLPSPFLSGTIPDTERPKAPPKVCLLPTVNRTLNLTPGEDDNEVFKDLTQWKLVVADSGDTKLTSTLEGDENQAATITVEASLLSSSAYYRPSTNLIPKGDSPGILFRDWQPWKITIVVDPNPAATTNCHITRSSSATVAMLPNGGAMFYVDVSRQALIEKKVSLSVMNGMLTGVDVSRPSPNLAALKLPLTILQAVTSAVIPTSSHSTDSSSSKATTVGGQ